MAENRIQVLSKFTWPLNLYNRLTITSSCSIGLKCLMSSLSRDGWTRLVSRTTEIKRSRSIQKEVPVKPRCPTLLAEKCLPALEFFKAGASKPSALLVFGRRLKNKRTSTFTRCTFTFNLSFLITLYF